MHTVNRNCNGYNVSSASSYDLPFFIAAILAFRSSRRLAISLSFSSLLILAILGAAAGAAVGMAATGSSSGVSSHPEAAGAGAGEEASGTVGLEGGLGEVTGVALAGLVTELDAVGFVFADAPFVCEAGFT